MAEAIEGPAEEPAVGPAPTGSATRSDSWLLRSRYTMVPAGALALTLGLVLADLRRLAVLNPGRLLAFDGMAGLGEAGDFYGGEKFLVYRRADDWCKGIKHWQWSFLCGVAEAAYLNRTWVMDYSFCLWWAHNPGAGRNIEKDFRLYYSSEHLAKYVRLIEWHAFHKELQSRTNAGREVTVLDVDENYAASELKLLDVPIVRRTMTDKRNPYWYRVCDRPVNKAVLIRNFNMLWRQPHLHDMAEAIIKRLGGVYDGVHIRRGDKVYQKNWRGRWPHLDRDTRPPKLYETLLKLVTPGRPLYVATDERPTFFAAMDKLFNASFLSSYSDLWQPGSAWYKSVETILAQRQTPEFDGYMRTLVDYDVFGAASKKIETFNDLTDDPRSGRYRRR
eukprot:SM000097S24825  [mRNA]  locus=s97:403361:405813:- [translate_table: standard]